MTTCMVAKWSHWDKFHPWGGDLHSFSWETWKNKKGTNLEWRLSVSLLFILLLLLLLLLLRLLLLLVLLLLLLLYGLASSQVKVEIAIASSQEWAACVFECKLVCRRPETVKDKIYHVLMR